MKLTIVPFDVGKDLKELEFNWGVRNAYNSKGRLWDSPYTLNSELTFGCAAPEQSLVVKWFRDIHNIHVIVEIASSSKTVDYVYSWNAWRNHKHGYMDWNPMNGSDWEGYDNFEQAELEGIRAAIKYLKHETTNSGTD